MLMRKPYRRDHESVPWWNLEIATLRRTCLRAIRALQRSRRTDRAEAAHTAFKQARRTLKHAILDSKRECFLKLCDAAEQDPWGGACILVVKQVNAGSRSQRTLKPLARLFAYCFRRVAPRKAYSTKRRRRGRSRKLRRTRLLKQDAACRTTKPLVPTQCPTEQ